MKNEKPSIRVRLEPKKSGAKARVGLFVAVNARAYTSNTVASAPIGQIEAFAGQLYVFERSLSGEVVLEAGALAIRVKAMNAMGHIEARVTLESSTDVLSARFETDPISLSRFADGLLAGLRDPHRVAVLDGF